MRVVLDTNILVSAFLKPHSLTAKILRLALQKEIEPAVDNRIINEYKPVLARPKFDLQEEKVKNILDLLISRSLKAPAINIFVKLPDEDDAPFLEVALAVKTKHLVTGNKKHYPAKLCTGVKIVSPREFLTQTDFSENV